MKATGRTIECECGGEMIECEYWYGSDADGNRGEIRYAYKCLECGEEEE